MKRRLQPELALPPRGVLYLRDSGGRHEMTPTQYFAWAERRARDFELSFRGSGDEIARMIHQGIPVSEDLFLDYGVKGNQFSRPALDELLKQVTVDRSISHVFIPRRDRLARPENPVDGMQLELKILEAGATVVTMDAVIAPPKNGQHGIEKLICMLIDYHRSGRDRFDLAEKIILAQIGLAKLGFSTGGRPPYAFERWLVDAAGTRVRKLEPGEVVRKQGHHVVWLPKFDSPELETALRIRRELLHKPASQIKRELTAEGVPSPDAGRTRTDNGVKHETSGEWHVNTITAIGRNSLYSAVASYGNRSMGDQLRFSPTGPRPLNTQDRTHDKDVKVIRNDRSDVIRTKAHFDPIVSREEDAELQRVLDQRAGSQRDKPRSRDPQRNPLGCRVFDMNCGWPMYREPYLGGFRHVCGAYRHRKCGYHHVDGPTTVNLAISKIQQRLVSPKTMDAFQATLAALQTGVSIGPDVTEEIREKELTIVGYREELVAIEKNMARATSDRQYNAISREFERLSMQIAELEAEIVRQKEKETSPPIVNKATASEIEILLEKVSEMAVKSDDYSTARTLFDTLGVRLFFSFGKAENPAERKIPVLGGIVTFGDAPPPVTLYRGPTGRRGKSGTKQEDHPRPPMVGKASFSVDQMGKEDTLANVSRGDRI